jgi:type VI secretion system protein ImpI
VNLILEVTSSQAAKLRDSRHEFGQDGGTIGREADNTWVLPDPRFSGHHARISWRDGVFYIEDTRSTNHVYLNGQRLPPGTHALNSGDSIRIDQFQIRVSIAGDERDVPRRREEPRAARMPTPSYDASSPFDLEDDPFAPRSDAPPDWEAAEESLGSADLDTLALLNLPTPRTPPQAPNAKDLERGSPLDAHFKPPAYVSTSPPPPSPAPAPAPAPDANMIPDGYDPLADEPSAIKSRPPSPPPPAAPRERAPAVPSREPAWPGPSPASDPFTDDIVEAPRRPAPAGGRRVAPEPQIPPDAPLTPAPRQPPEPVKSAPPPAAVAPAPVVSAPPVAAAPPAVPPAPPASPQPGSGPPPSANLAAVLEGAGLDPADVTPELARTFGQILRVVVSGTMDVLRARQQIKDEFRMRMTRFRAAENNPLKFSANVDDALHNLLVKRNAAYLGPVESFEDAFDDLRNHQIAMLAGMRVAFEAMLAQFDPDRLQEDFDRTSKGCSTRRRS